ncbi:hypothetical protein [Rhodococcus opacus]|uniref:hypothetical protein n=1 Tax=Rhodococcus opacus TaxID=37919 RepID=UPI001C48AF21|nr:hypothetical protein [Rhodococcus opacus]MBV6758372.1 hypothetical protein [Rhodococcus opacus]
MSGAQVLATIYAAILLGLPMLGAVWIGRRLDRADVSVDAEPVIVVDDANLLGGVEIHLATTARHLPAWPRWQGEDERELDAETLRDHYVEARAADFDDNLIEYTTRMLRLIQTAHASLLATLGPRATRAVAAEITRHDLALPDSNDPQPPQIEAVLRAHGWKPE